MTAEQLHLLKRVRSAATGAVLWPFGCLLDGQGILIILSGFLSKGIGTFTPRNNSFFVDDIFQTLLHSCTLSWNIFWRNTKYYIFLKEGTYIRLSDNYTLFIYFQEKACSVGLIP